MGKKAGKKLKNYIYTILMIKKMEISCSCGKKYKNRAWFEKHHYKCQTIPFAFETPFPSSVSAEVSPMELLKMIRSLSARVTHLETQVDAFNAGGAAAGEEIPSKNFQEELKEMPILIQDICWTEKINSIILTIVKDVLGEMKSVRRGKTTLVYEDEWVKLKDISCARIEPLVRNVQKKLLAELNQDDQYFHNISKITNVDISKWVKDHIAKI
jgi:hypothetical protein